ncbi:MAG TPA: NrfD/PsrC family molybdoenzyme membrane anchor subunit, partial [Cyclobacteriaceae bacterium]|nr:NrfD/PsrC family molybdoenzyme membrane anchor subunit [Cyclobacteriaceae bacterium]
FLGKFWKGNSEQEAILEKSIRILLITIIPIALAIHTVTSWLFATTYRSGWDSTNFGAYFVSGAFLVGAGGVVVAMFVFRRAYHLESYITNMHFDRMGKLLVMLALLYLYFNINEYLVPAFKMKKSETEHLQGLFTGEFAPLFWSVVIFGMIVPILMLLFPAGRKPLPMFIAGLLVVVGAWFKRFLIVTPTLLHPFLPKSNVPENYLHYFPSWQEWAITAGSLAGALLVMTLFTRLFPIIPIEETIHERKEGAG